MKCFLLPDALLTHHFGCNVEGGVPLSGHAGKRGKKMSGSDNLDLERLFIFIVPLIVIEFFPEVNPS